MQNYPQTPTVHALREERFKYIRYHGVWDVDELYDLSADPRETRNLIFDLDHRDRVSAMRSRLFEMLEAGAGTRVPLALDRGTRFFHRRQGGLRAADFPPVFYRGPDQPAQKRKEKEDDPLR